MEETLKKLINKRYFHLCVILTIIIIMLFILGIIVLRYNVEGETNMPFNLSKITIISSSEGIDKDSGENKWAYDIAQNNDIYIYIEKNKRYTREEVIKSVNISNINISKEMQKGEITLYKPDQSSKNIIFKNSEENKVDQIEYIGDMESSIQQMKIRHFV